MKVTYQTSFHAKKGEIDNGQGYFLGDCVDGDRPLHRHNLAEI